MPSLPLASKKFTAPTQCQNNPFLAASAGRLYGYCMDLHASKPVQICLILHYDIFWKIASY